MGESKAAGEEITDKPRGDEEQEYRHQNETEGGRVGEDGGDVPGENADHKRRDHEGYHRVGKAQDSPENRF